MTKVNDLHKKAILYTSGTAQAGIIKTLLDESFLKEDEINYYKKVEMHRALVEKKKILICHFIINQLGFESMMGYLYLTNQGLEQMKL